MDMKIKDIGEVRKYWITHAQQTIERCRQQAAQYEAAVKEVKERIERLEELLMVVDGGE